jgi:hypothetical protein
MACCAALGGHQPGVAHPDRMATVVHPASDRITAQFAQAAKHYGVEVWVCPPRRPQRKGVVEKAIQYVTRSRWRTAPVSTLGQAQADLDRWPAAVADRRTRQGATIVELAARRACSLCPRSRSPLSLRSARRRPVRAGRVRGQPPRRLDRPGRADRDRYGPCRRAARRDPLGRRQTRRAAPPRTGWRRPAAAQRRARPAEFSRSLTGFAERPVRPVSTPGRPASDP